MFVKIITTEEEIGVERFFDCKRASLIPHKSSSKASNIDEIVLIMDVGNQDERIINIPYNRNDVKTEVYYMNNEGKTIQRYQY